MPGQIPTWTESSHLLFLGVITQLSFLPIARFIGLLLGNAPGRLTFVLIYESVVFMVTFATIVDARQT
jgi:hypothetical protein